MTFTLSVRSFHVPATPGTCAWATQLAVGADLAGHTGYFSGERVELVHHRVDGVLEFENFSLHVYRDFARQVATGHGGRHLSDVTDLASEVSGHGVH